MEWYFERIGKPLKGTTPDGTEVNVIIRNKENAAWFLLASERGWSFYE
jgi:hypothetical protein